MQSRRLVLLSCLGAMFLSVFAAAQTTTSLSAATSNNTSACSASALSSYCQAGFTAMSDSTSGVYNAAPGNVSDLDIHSVLYPGATTRILAHFQPWFCMQPGSTVTGTGTNCNGHVQVGYNSNDSATVAGQMNDMIQRGINGVVVDWYGAGHSLEEGTTQKVLDDLNNRCTGAQSCPLLMALMEDQGSFTAQCPMNGNGADQTACISQAIENDLDYMNANYLGAAPYLKVNKNTMQPDALGHPVVFFFVCESCFTNPSPDWTSIWNTVRSHVQSFATGDPVLWFIFRNSVGFSHVQSDGAFAWVNHYGSNDPYGLVYLDNFYDTSIKYPNSEAYGAGWKGFDSTNAPWRPSQTATPQQCGVTWLQTLAEETHNSDYSTSHQLPFIGLVTWNDYDEGTEIETGIDNCLSLSASVAGTVLSWTPSFSQTSGSESSVDHYSVFDSTDGQNLTLAATLPAGTHSVDLNTLVLPNGSSTLYVKAIGKATIQNRISNPVTYASPTTGTISGTVVASGTNAPIAGATVGYSAESTMTDSSGNFTVANVPSGTISLTASATGYQSSSQPVAVSAGSTATANFALPSAYGAITGKVTDIITGLPIASAIVSYSGGSMLTDSGGTYTFINLSPGSYTVSASATGYLARSATISVTAGTTATANFPLARYGTLTGKITKTNGATISGATIKISGGVLATTNGTSSGTHGNYTFSSIPVGSYTVTVSKNGYTTQSKTATILAGATTTVNFTMQ